MTAVSIICIPTPKNMSWVGSPTLWWFHPWLGAVSFYGWFIMIVKAPSWHHPPHSYGDRDDNPYKEHNPSHRHNYDKVTAIAVLSTIDYWGDWVAWISSFRGAFLCLGLGRYLKGRTWRLMNKGPLQPAMQPGCFYLLWRAPPFTMPFCPSIMSW